MGFDVAEWKERIEQRLQAFAANPRQALKEAGAETLLGYLLGMTFFPLAQAVAEGELAALSALFSIARGIGANLIANKVQHWHDETTAARELERELPASSELRQTLAKILAELEVIGIAQQRMGYEDHSWFAERLVEELQPYREDFIQASPIFGYVIDSLVITAGRDFHLTYIGDQKVHPGMIEEPPATLEPDVALQVYLDHVVDSCQHLRLQGIRSAEPLSIDLNKIYITLNVMERRFLEVEVQPLVLLGEKVPRDESCVGERGREVEVVVPINQALAKHRRLAVLGATGSGKTTFLSYLALTYARDFRGDLSGLVKMRLGLDEVGKLPIFLPLREFAQHLAAKWPVEAADGPLFLLDYLRNYFENYALPLPERFFAEPLEAGDCVVLFDGMDEVADPEQRRRVARIVEGFTRRYPENRYLVASRTAGYAGAARLGEDYYVTTVRDFDEEAIEQFVGKWSLMVEVVLAGKHSPTVEKRAQDRAEELLKAITNSPRVTELAVNPLLLTVIALVHRYRATLPQRRAELYEECIEVLLGYWDQAKGLGEEARILDRKMDTGDKRGFLEPIALRMHEARQREIERDELYEQLCALFASLTREECEAEKMAEAFVEVIRERSGLLQERGPAVCSFSHLTFQEYLAARSIAGGDDYIDRTLSKLGDEWWREVVLLEAGYLSIGGKKRTTQLIQAIADCEQEEERYHNLILAAECLRDVGPARVEGDLWEKTTIRLLKAMGDDSARMMRRVAVGDALGEIGDPRFHGPYLEPELVEVPAGEFWMGSEAGYYDDEKPVQRVWMDTFHIAECPVTNAQYQNFVKAGGYGHPQYWPEAGWDYIRVEERTCPLHWDRVREKLNHPVVYVSWYEAVAYCRWLSEVTGKDYRLPTEAQWEKAARGDKDRRDWPWAEEWDQRRCNSTESGIYSTTPVGIYLQGISPYGAIDMVGNVWEWCSSLEKPYLYKADDGRENLEAKGARILRGGSFLNRRTDSRVTARPAADPGYSFVNAGLRVVVPPSGYR